MPATEFPPIVPFTDQVTLELYEPVPETLAEHCVDCDVGTCPATHVMLTDEIVGAPDTLTVVAAVLDESWTEVAVMTAVPVPEGVNVPADVILPPVAAQLTAELNEPVPCTFAAQAEVAVERIALGLQAAEIEVIVGWGGATA